MYNRAIIATYFCVRVFGVSVEYAYVAAGACLHWICAAHLSFLLSLRPNFRPLQALVSTFYIELPHR